MGTVWKAKTSRKPLPETRMSNTHREGVFRKRRSGAERVLISRWHQSHASGMQQYFPSLTSKKCIPKTIGNTFIEKETVREVALGGLTSPEKIFRSKSTNQSGERNERLLICAFRSEDFLRWSLSPERNLTHKLFSISNSFWYYLIHFFDEKKEGAAENSIVCFGASIPCHAIWQERNEGCKLLRRVERFGNGKCKLSAIQEGERGANFFANTKLQIFGKEKCKIHRQFQRYFGDVTSVSLSLCNKLIPKRKPNRPILA